MSAYATQSGHKKPSATTDVKNEVILIGGRRSFKVGGKGCRDPSGIQGQSLWWGLEAFPEADDTFFVKICYIVTVLQMNLYSLPTSVQYETEENSTWMQKSGRESTSACPFEHKKWADDPIYYRPGPICSAASGYSVTKFIT